MTKKPRAAKPTSTSFAGPHHRLLEQYDTISSRRLREPGSAPAFWDAYSLFKTYAHRHFDAIKALAHDKMHSSNRDVLEWLPRYEMLKGVTDILMPLARRFKLDAEAIYISAKLCADSTALLTLEDYATDPELRYVRAQWPECILTLPYRLNAAQEQDARRGMAVLESLFSNIELPISGPIRFKRHSNSPLHKARGGRPKHTDDEADAAYLAKWLEAKAQGIKQNQFAKTNAQRRTIARALEKRNAAS